MRKSTMKKLFATLAVALTASVGAGVALIDYTTDVSADSSVLNSCTQSTDAFAVDTNGVAVYGTVSDVGVTEGNTSLYVTSNTQWFTAYISVGTMTAAQLQSYESISFDITASMTMNWHAVGAYFGSSNGGETTTLTLPVETINANPASFVEGSPSYISCIVQSAAETAEYYIDNVNAKEKAKIEDGFESNVTVSWDGNKASLTGLDNGKYVASNKAYEFANDEVLVFETTFVTNSVWSSPVAGNKLSFVYGADSKEALTTSTNRHSTTQPNFICYGGADQTYTWTDATQFGGDGQGDGSQDGSGWINLPAPAGTITYYVHADGGTDLYVNGVRNGYILGTAKDGLVTDALAQKWNNTAADRNGYLGWVSTGTGAIDMSYTSLKVGKTSEFAVGEGAPGEITWLAAHENPYPQAPETTVSGMLVNNCEGEAGYWFGTNGTRESVTYVKSEGEGSYKLVLNAYSYMTPLLVDYAAGAAVLTEEQFLAYDGVYMEIYNPGETVNLFLYSTLAQQLENGWNQVSIPMETIVEQLELSKAARENDPTCPLQFEGGQFFLSVGAACELYVDNIMLLGGGDVGGDTPEVGGGEINPEAFQSFETVKMNVAAGVESVDVSTNHVTEGNYSNKLTTNQQWFEIQVNLDSMEFGEHNAVAFDFYVENSTLSLLHYFGAEHKEYAGKSGTWILDKETFNALLSGNTFVVTASSSTLGVDVIYFDNFRPVTIDISGGEGGDTPEVPDTPDTPDVGGDENTDGTLLQGFESVVISTGTTGVASIETSTSHVTQGTYSNKVATNNQWFEIHIRIDGTISTEYDSIALDFYVENGKLHYFDGVEHVSLQAQSGTFYFPHTVASTGNFVMVFVATSVTDIYFDNLRLANDPNVGGGGDDSGDVGGEDIEITGTTQYTKFDSNTLSGWEKTSSAVSIGNGELTFTDGGTLVSTGTYKNFILEYDLTITNKNEGAWIPIASIAVNNTSYSVDLQKSIVFNAWGAVYGYNLAFNPYAAGLFVYENTSAPTAHVKLEAQEGKLTLTLTINGLASTTVLCSGVNTAGKVAITACAGSTIKIDNLVLINSDEYANYDVTQIILANGSAQINAGETITGNLLNDLRESAAAQGIDITNKLVTFRSKTDGFFINSTTGEWEYTAGMYNGGYLLDYVITIQDLVLDGWVYPLGEKGTYTIEGNIAVDVMGGKDPGEGGGGGAGDTAYMPEVVGENTAAHTMGAIQDVSFIIDTKTYTIISITLLTDKGEENVKSAAYTLTEVAEGMKVTFKGDFMALLSEKTHEFKITTAKGSATVSVVVTSLKAPVLSGDTTATMTKYSETNAVFTLDTDGLEILTVLRLGTQLALNDQAYSFVDNTLTINKEYLATLAADTYTFVIYTEGGDVSVSITINPVDEPIVVGDDTLVFEQGSNEDVVFDIEFFGEAVIQVVREGATKALNENAYEYDVDACTFTFKAEYLLTLTDDVNLFIISTRGGDVYVAIELGAAQAPSISGTASKSVTVGSKTNVTFSIDTANMEILSIVRDGAANGLSNNAFTYADGTLTILGDYVALLPVGNNEFTLETIGGTVEFTIVVTAIKLSAPVVTLNENVASWTEIDGATAYVYKINGGAEQTANGLSVTLTPGQSVVVKAVGDGATTSDSDWSNAVTYSLIPQLTAPVVTLNGNVASWAAVNGAVSYTYSINGNEQTTTELSVTLQVGESLKVKANGNNSTTSDSNWSNVVTLSANKLAAPVVTIDGYVASWTAVDGASSYVYKLNGNEQTTTALTVTLEFGDVLQVKAVGGSALLLDSDWSNVVMCIEMPEVDEDDDLLVEEDDNIGGDESDDFFTEELPEEEPTEPETPEEQPSGDGSSYEEAFTGSVKPSKDAYDKYMAGLAAGGQVSDGCNGSLSVLAGLPMVGLVAWFIRKKKED